MWHRAGVPHRAGRRFSDRPHFYHGNNKTRWELEYALEKGVGTIVLTRWGDLTFESLLEARGTRQRVLLRVTPGDHGAHTHDHIQD